MLRLPKQLASAELTTSIADQYTAPTNNRTTISACTVTNKTATAYYVTITQTPSGGSARNLAYQVVVPAKSVYVVAGAIGQTLDTGGKISALAEANSALDFTMSGYVTTLPSA